jgi:hypothetical protein
MGNVVYHLAPDGRLVRWGGAPEDRCVFAVVNVLLQRRCSVAL